MTPGPSSSRPDRGQEGWPPNAVNLHHRVDFRRAWMPSPEMPRPPLPDSSLPGIEEDEDEDEVEHEHEHGHPLGSRRARPRSSRMYGREGNQNQNLNQNVNPNSNPSPNPAPKRSASGSTGSTAVHTHTHTYVGHSCKRPLRSTGTLSGNGAPAYAFNAQQAQTRPGDDLPVHVPRVRQAPASASSARPCPRPRPRSPAREQEHGEQAHELVRRKSWLSVLSPKKLFSPRKRHSVAETADASLGHTYLTNGNAANEDVNEIEDESYASTSANASANTEFLGRTHAAHVQVQKREVHPAEWRAYGMWARPWFGKEYGEMIVRNATPPNPPRELSPPQVEAMVATLWDDERPHPDRWIARVQHASLPPRPDLWPTPRQTYNPLPEELQLNPFLKHYLLGRPALQFDLRLRAEDVTLGQPPPAPTPYTHTPPLNYRPPPWLLQQPPSAADAESARARAFVSGPNGAQPATFPGVPRLRITAVAGDAQHAFAWPVTVLPHDEALPVLVADVVHALVANFEERLACAEADALSDARRVMVYQAYWRRMRLPVGGRIPPEDDGLRRVDYLGDMIYFRGLEPNPSGDGFVLFLGPPP